MDFDLVLLGQSYRDEPVADLGPLVPLELEDLTVLGVLDYSPIAGEFLWTKGNDLDNHSTIALERIRFLKYLEQ